jgi:hypothetical protein
MTFTARPNSITKALLALIAERPGLTVRDYAPELATTTRRLDASLWNLQRKGIVQEGRKVPGWRCAPMRTWYLAGTAPAQVPVAEDADDEEPRPKTTKPLPLIDQHPLSMAWVTKPNNEERDAV